MKTIYISGPLRAETPYLTERNISKAKQAAEFFWYHGFAVLCPHLNTLGMIGMLPDEHQFIQGDIRLLQGMDYIAMLTGWESSEGAVMEREAAKRLNIIILTEHPWGSWYLPESPICLSYSDIKALAE